MGWRLQEVVAEEIKIGGLEQQTQEVAEAEADIIVVIGGAGGKGIVIIRYKFQSVKDN